LILVTGGTGFVGGHVVHELRSRDLPVRCLVRDLRGGDKLAAWGCELVEVKPDEAFILHPGEFVLGSTLERVGIPDDLVARLEGKSSLGRLGLLIHSTAGFIDPGWDGHVTLELSNVANLPVTIYPEMKIGQISFVQLTEPAATPYGTGEIGSKYQGQRGPTPSKYWQNFAREAKT
jgi:dCTP deaminase